MLPRWHTRRVLAATIAGISGAGQPQQSP